jgi:F-type H+-transporting ATPase subunit epsilon
MATYSSTPIKLELVTPEELLFSGDVDMVVIPGVEGDFGVLFGHAPLISLIRPGVVTIYNTDNSQEKLFVSGGFAEVTNTECTILAEEARPLADITQAFADERLHRARKHYDKATSDTEKSIAAKEIAIAEAMLELLNMKVIA